MSENQATQLTKKDFVSDQAVRWCPGCGDYAILAQAQKQMPTFGRKREDIVFVSGIGCSSRFPYYMNTYGFHSIHGRAPAVATGVKLLIRIYRCGLLRAMETGCLLEEIILCMP